MVFVPAGDYLDGDPPESIYLDAFWIDRTEVTNGKYAECVMAGVCSPPPPDTMDRDSYYDNPQYSYFPVVAVTFAEAREYCEWLGKRLPTSEEWEKAARGADGRIYPWGNDYGACDRANINKCVRDTIGVGSLPSGSSPYGALDMIGNVWEWVGGPSSEGYRQGACGGGWADRDPVAMCSSSVPDPAMPEFAFFDRGFRCAKSGP